MVKVVGAVAAGVGLLLNFLMWAFPYLFIAAGAYLVYEALRGYDERIAAIVGGLAFIVAGVRMLGGKR